jgi:hypothetical protein
MEGPKDQQTRTFSATVHLPSPGSCTCRWSQIDHVSDVTETDKKGSSLLPSSPSIDATSCNCTLRAPPLFALDVDDFVGATGGGGGGLGLTTTGDASATACSLFM